LLAAATTGFDLGAIGEFQVLAPSDSAVLALLAECFAAFGGFGRFVGGGLPIGGLGFG